MPFKIPLDAYIVAVPTIYACCALTGLVYKTLTADPEMSTIAYYDKDEKVIGRHGEQWNESVSSLFRERIHNHKWGVFNNEYKAQ